MIIDAQVHLWARDDPSRPWPPGTTPMDHRLITTAELVAEMDQAGVDRAVLVPPSWEGERNDLVLAAAHAHPDRFLVMGRVPLSTGTGEIERWRQDPAMAGMRITAHAGPQRAWLTSDERPWFWTAVEAAGLPVMLYAPGLIDEVTRLLEAHPGLRLTLDHINLPLETDASTIEAAVAGVLALARFENLCVKVSALDCHVPRADRTALIPPIVARVVEAFGAERVFWGTDLTRNPVSYRETVTVFSEQMPALSEAQRRLIMGEAISRWLPWPIEGTA